MSRPYTTGTSGATYVAAPTVVEVPAHIGFAIDLGGKRFQYQTSLTLAEAGHWEAVGRKMEAAKSDLRLWIALVEEPGIPADVRFLMFARLWLHNALATIRPSNADRAMVCYLLMCEAGDEAATAALAGLQREGA